MNQVVVSPNTLPFAALFRYVLVMLGTFAVGRGWVATENIEGLITAIVTILTVLYGLYKTFTTKKDLIVAADAAPDSIARVEHSH